MLAARPQRPGILPRRLGVLGQGEPLVDVLVAEERQKQRREEPEKSYIEKSYPRTRNDVYVAFVERGLDLLHPAGLLGATTSRTGFFLSSFRKWREEIVLGEARPAVVADLGQGVLDTATVETAAYVLEKAR